MRNHATALMHKSAPRSVTKYIDIPGKEAGALMRRLVTGLTYEAVSYWADVCCSSADACSTSYWADAWWTSYCSEVARLGYAKPGVRG